MERTIAPFVPYQAVRSSKPRRGRLSYRRTTVTDVEVLVDHRHRMWSAIGHRTEAEIAEHDPRYRRWVRPRLRSGQVIGIIAEAAGGEPAGSGLVWFRPDQPRPKLPTLVSPYILSMYTVPAWRHRGVATRIVRELLVLCREAGYPNAELHASRFGRRVYRGLGFERTWEMRIWIDRRFAPNPRASKTHGPMGVPKRPPQSRKTGRGNRTGSLRPSS